MSGAATTGDLYATLAARILDHVPAGSPTPATVRMQLTGGLWVVQPPENPAYPYGMLRLMNQQTSGQYHGERQLVDLEVLLYHRPRSQQRTLEDLADLVDEAMLRFVNIADGVILGRERVRDSLPFGMPPSERDVCGIRLVFSLIVWPAWLTQYSLAEA